MRAHRLLAALDKVRQTGKSTWMARCPAHDDRNPSLSVGEMPDGRILIHCHAGCGGAEVMGAVGMTLSDLYPEGALGEFGPLWWQREDKRAKDAKAFRAELVLAQFEAKRQRGEVPTAKELEQEREAFQQTRGRCG